MGRDRWATGGRETWVGRWRMGGWTKEQRGGWAGGRKDRGTGTDQKEPSAPLPHLDVVIELPEAFVSQDLVYRLLGHLLQPCGTASPGAPPQHLGDQAPPSAPGAPPGSGLSGRQLHPNPAQPIWLLFNPSAPRPLPAGCGGVPSPPPPPPTFWRKMGTGTSFSTPRYLGTSPPPQSPPLASP